MAGPSTAPDEEREPTDTDEDPNPPYDLPSGASSWTEWCT